MTDSTPIAPDNNTTSSARPRVLIVGGGFGGVKVALELCKHNKYDITLISDQKVFRYYPALYHTATGGLYKQSNIPLERILNTDRIQLIHSQVTMLDRQKKLVATSEGQSYPYDILVLALGVVTNYFGIEGLEEFSFGIKSWEQIQDFKHHLHSLLNVDTPPQHYVIVGAGPTGIEVAGSLPAYLRTIMKKHGVKDQRFQISIVEALPRLLPHSSEKISSAVAKRLQRLGIELKLDQKVEGAHANELMVNGEPISSSTVLWTAGTANHPFFKANNFSLTDRGKVNVDAYLQAEPDIYVVGDNANTEFSGLAQTALHNGIFVAEDIERRHNNLARKEYKPKKPITVIPVGSHWATVEWGKQTFAGFFGWLLRAAADWVGFHDLEPWWRASAQWMTEFGEEEDCPTCNPSKQKTI